MSIYRVALALALVACACYGHRRFVPNAKFGSRRNQRSQAQHSSLAKMEAAHSSSAFATRTSGPLEMVAALENVQPANGAEITEENPLRVLIAGAGVGGLVLANGLVKNPKMNVTVLERTEEFRRFGGPIQLASNALQILKEQDSDVFAQIMEKFYIHWRQEKWNQGWNS